MLTGDQSIVAYDAGRAVPDRLTRKRHAHYVEYAARMLDIYRRGAGLERRELHRSVRCLLSAETDCHRRRIEAFCKLLDDAAEFDEDARGTAADLRLRVFSLAAPCHPLVREADGIFDRTESQAKARIAQELGQSWDQIDAGLYADVEELQRLVRFEPGYADPAAILSRYNVAQVQACLYRARRMTILAGTDFAAILRYAKLCRLLVEVRRADERRYRIDLSGPASVLAQTRRYGVNFARFVPALLACRDWSMRAVVATLWGREATLDLSSRDGLSSHLPPPAEFDSSVEEQFARKFGPQRNGWRLVREGAILHQGQLTFVPDFVFRHQDGREAMMEIVGFWTPEYLQKKRQTLSQFRHHRILLAVAARSLRKDAPIGEDVIVYKTALKVQSVVDALAGM
jgi:predicted nuclease of restriction endonuclease-like RecB superfamily